MSMWNDMSTRGLLFSVSWHYKNPTKYLTLVQMEHLTEM